MASSVLIKLLTGRATEIEVASRAAIKVMTDRLAKAARNRHPGLKGASAELCEFSDMDETSCEDAASWLGDVVGMSSLDSSTTDRDKGVDIDYQGLQELFENVWVGLERLARA